MDDHSQLILPVTGQELGQFISSLLGQRRTIEQRFAVPSLLVRSEALINLVDVLDQRISQNDATMASFRCKYYFANGRIATVYDVSSFKTFDDSSPEDTIGIDMTISYLIQFPGSSIPEKQDIRVELFSNEKLKDGPGSELFNHPLARFEIQMTNLTWGEDISSHLNKQMHRFLFSDKLQRMAAFLKGASPVLISTGIISAFFVSLLFGGRDQKTQEFLPLLKKLPEAVTLENINSKVDLLLNYTIYESKFSWWDVITPRLGVFVFALILLGYAFRLLTRYGAFYIVACTRANQERLTEFLKKREYIIWTIYASFFVGVIAGVIGTRLDTLLFPSK